MTLERQDFSVNGPEPIALVGAGCWLPGRITSLAELRAALREGRDLISEIPADRWDADEFFDPDALQPGKTYVRRGGFVEGIDRFDPAFFGISDDEAARMDPQQRMVLQTVWHALEDAGQSADELERSNTGVFLAMMNTNNYSQLKAVFEGLEGLTAYDAMSDAMSIAAGRVAHFLGVEGPTLALDTACSSSLVALHLARQSILAGDCDTAIIVGVNAILHPGIHIAFSKVGLMSRAGRCAAFDAAADGYIRGEGCVAVVLKRQSEALARGDRVLASIVGTAVNQDGRTPAVTAPNGRAQEKVIRTALARLGTSPDEIGYLEAHGTGTPVGDPIEMSAIANVFGPGRASENRLHVGSVKTNFGHIEAGAGLLGLLKAALSVHYGEIYPNLHFEQLNPGIDLGEAPIVIPTEAMPWPQSSSRRMAGVNSFGYSGTNAHVILQQPPQLSAASDAADEAAVDRPAELVVLSAKSEPSLETLVESWINYLDSQESGSLPDIAFTAATGRAHLSHRLALVGSDKEQLAALLRSWQQGQRPQGLFAGRTHPRIAPKVAFVFTGQGAQYAGMGEDLYRREARFARSLDRVAELMDPELGVAIKDVLFGPQAEDYLSNTRYVQPALFALEYALADLLQHWGLEPDVLIGHSIGEIAAACVAGMLDLGDAVRFVVARGRLMGDLPPGGKMVAIGAGMDQVQPWLAGYEREASIATVNAPNSVVISGTAAAVDAIAKLAESAGLRTSELKVSHAFHSPLMDPILEELAQVAQSMRVAPPRIPILSNVSGDFHGDQVEPEYWSDHVRQAVLFHAGMQKAVESGATVIVEVGPHPALTPAVATSFDSGKVHAVPTLRRGSGDFENLLAALAALFARGARMKLENLFWSPSYKKLPLPLYPFRKERHWLIEEGGLQMPRPRSAEPLPELPELHPMLGQVVNRSHRRTEFQIELETRSPWTDHRVLGSTIFPGTAYLDMAARGYAAINGVEWLPVTFKNVRYERPLLLSYRQAKAIRLILKHGGNGSGAVQFSIVAADNENEQYCQGTVTALEEERESLDSPLNPDGESAPMEIGSFYGELRKGGLEYGAMFAVVRELWTGPEGSGAARGRVALTPAGQDGGLEDPTANARLMDGSLQVFGAALRTGQVQSHPGAYVPATVESVRLWQQLPAAVWSQVSITEQADGKAALVDISVTDEDGQLLADFQNAELRVATSMEAGAALPAAKSGPSSLAFTGLAAKSRAELIELLRPMDRSERVGELVKWLTAEIKDTMGQAADGLEIDSLPPSTAFLEIGLNSLLVTELQRRIQEKLEFRFKPMEGLDYQSIESMAEYLHDETLEADLSSPAEPAEA